MIVHKTFTGNTFGKDKEEAFERQENLREQVEDFLLHELNEEDVIRFTEATSSALHFSISVWYRKGEFH